MRCAQLDRLVGAVGAVRVDQQLDVRPDRLADRPTRSTSSRIGTAPIFILIALAPISTLSSISCCELLAGPCPPRSSRRRCRSARDRGSRRASCRAAGRRPSRADVPAGRCRCRDRPRGQAAAADQLRHPHLVPEALDVDRVFADQHPASGARWWPVRFRRRRPSPMPDDALVGLDLDQAKARVGVGVLAVRDRLVPRPAVLLGRDAGDLHGAASTLRAAFNVLSRAGASAPTRDSDPTGAPSIPRRSRDRSSRAACQAAVSPARCCPA